MSFPPSALEICGGTFLSFFQHGWIFSRDAAVERVSALGRTANDERTSRPKNCKKYYCEDLGTLRSVYPSTAQFRLQCRGCGILKDLQLNCPSLERLDCAYCRSLPDQALSSICAAAPRLNSLVLSVCTAVGCSGLLELQNLRHLRMLDLSYTEIEARRLRFLFWFLRRSVAVLAR